MRLEARIRCAAAVLTCAAALAGCATGPGGGCATGEQRVVQDQFFFGTSRPSGGAVTLEEWADFLAKTVTPRFPQGLTVWDGAGQWRSQQGEIQGERSRVLTLVHPDAPSSDKSVQEIGDAYKNRFQQQAVLRTRVFVCAAI